MINEKVEEIILEVEDQEKCNRGNKSSRTEIEKKKDLEKEVGIRLGNILRAK